MCDISGAGQPGPLVASTTRSFYQKTRLNDLSYGIKIWTYFSSVLSQFTRLTDRQTDRQTDGILIARPRPHSMQHGKNVNGPRVSGISPVGKKVMDERI